MRPTQIIETKKFINREFGKLEIVPKTPEYVDSVKSDGRVL